MSELTTSQRETAALASTPLTPAGLQSLSTLTRRRMVMLTLVLTTVMALTGLWAHLLGGNGIDALDAGLIACFLLSAPWTVLGFWNAVIGFWLLHIDKRWRGSVAPYLAAGEGDSPITLNTAVLMTLRNEDPERALAKLERVRRSLVSTGFSHKFDFFVLSDTSNPHIAAAEERLVAEWKEGVAAGHNVIYRRREQNTGFKAGNVQDFIDRFGADYDLMLPLDADSLMAGREIVRMVRIMEATPKLGILQSLMVGTPSQSAFARILQFGGRHGMRSFTMGSAWWQADCGPFWGHNALVRIGPFRESCELPVLPGTPPLGGYVLSHDQVEAAMMRGAGYEVRVMPVECESWEDSPPTLLDFLKRDMRWCQGNMQYFQLLKLPNLKFISQLQLVIATMGYISGAAWMLFVILGAMKATTGSIEVFNPSIGIALFASMIFMNLAPKLLGMLDVAVSPGGLRRYGGGMRFGSGVLTEILFTLLLAPAIASALTIFMVGLLFGRSVKWNGQARDAYRLTWLTGIRGLWPQLLFGMTITALFAAYVPGILPWIAPMIAGLVLAIPVAVLSASPEVGGWFARRGLCAIPEEFNTPVELRHEEAPAAAERVDGSNIPAAEAIPAASAG